MIPQRTLTVYAEDRRAGLTVDELGEFIQHCHRNNATGDEHVAVVVNIKGGIKTISATIGDTP